MSRDYPDEIRIDTHPPFGWVDDDVRLQNLGDGYGNLEEKLDGLAATAEQAGAPFNRAETKRILTGKQVGRRGQHVDRRGVLHTTKRAMEAANKKYENQPYYGVSVPFPYGGAEAYARGLAQPAPGYTFEDAFRDAKVEIAAAEFAAMAKQATMVSRALEIGSAPPFAFVSFSFSRPWYQTLARKVGSFFERLGN